MTSQPDKTDAMLHALRARYRAGLATTLDTLELLATQLGSMPDASPVLESLRREMHRLHGSAGTYGFPQASGLAGALEARLTAWRADPQSEAAERSAIVGNFIRAFRASVLSEEGDAPVAETPMILMIGVSAAYARAVESEAVLRGFTTRTLEAESISREAIEAVAPRVIVTPASMVKKIPQEVAIPVIAVAGPGEAKTSRSKSGRSADITSVVVDPNEKPGTLLDLVQQMAARVDYSGATLLVVDDDPSILAIVRALAEHDGMRVVTRDSPEGIQDAIDIENPTMLLMDVQMGDTDGIAVTRELRGRPRNRDLPVLLFSGSMGIATREAGFRAGADDFFAKPIVPQELRLRLQQRLERRRLRRIANGTHGMLDVTLPSRTAHDAADAWSRKDGKTMAVIHPAPGFDDRGWFAEVRRLSTELGPHASAIGFHDGDALLVVTSEEEALAARRLAELRAGRPAGAPDWHAGVASRDRAGLIYERARAAALEALDVARRTPGTGAHQWTLADDAVAPDVIVVEDDISLSEMMQYALRAGGYTYRAFADGNAAHEALIEMRTGSRRPVVLLDIDLPGMDGHSLHERLRVERPGAFIVVFLSVHTGEGDQVRALHGGAWDYITKPLNLRVLMAKLPIWVARAAAQP